MLKVINRIFKRGEYQPLNRIELSQKNLLGNYKYLSSLNHNISISLVLKSNGYGHGLITLGAVLDSLGGPFFCVDSLPEAYQLIKAKIKTPILIMGYVDPANLKVRSWPFSFAIWDIDSAKALNSYQSTKVHIFVDTGMNREGVSLKDLPDFLSELKKLKNIEVEGLMSHLAVYTKNQAYPKTQLQNYQKALKISQSLGIDPKWRHLAASGGILNKYTRGTNMARVGIALFGIDRNNDAKGRLKPILSLKSKIIQVKKINKGSKIGYDGTYQAKKDMVIGVLPLGYNDGVDRRLSNQGVVLVGKVVCPIIGRISMNVTTIDLTQVKRPWVGQEVVVFSSNREDPNSIENIAKLCQTLPHDILVGLDPSIRRELI